MDGVGSAFNDFSIASKASGATSSTNRSRIGKLASLQIENRSSDAVDKLLARKSGLTPSALASNTHFNQTATNETVNEEEKHTRRTSMKLTPTAKAAFKKKIVGDLFGSGGGEQSLAGLMYRSRIVDRDASLNNNDNINDDSLVLDSIDSQESQVESDGDSDNENKMLKSMNPKQQLAVTIKNYLQFPENDELVIKEGAVYALIALSRVDDATIRRCCASAFYSLSSREKNRKQLLEMGTAAGIVYIALQPRSWKVARLCALALCNLSMHPDGEAVMAEEKCVLALVVLLGVKGPSLFPICMQSIYNLTCSKTHFKSIERIMKALLDFSAVGYDNSEFVIKALVNCSRFSWLRLRLIEYGAINNLHNLMAAIPTWKNNKHELVFHMLTALRSLSESSGCRTEMIQKNTMDLLVGLTPHCTDKDRLLIVKMLHNFLSTSTCLSAAAFSTTVTMLYDLVFRTSYIVILQYCAACLHMVTKEKIRGQKQHALKIIETMSILLPSKDPITQFFAISTSGNLFFGNLVDDHSKLELLIQYFVMNGTSIEDANAKQALALALAKLSEEEDYLVVIERLHLLDKVLHLLMHLRREHKESLVLQESCCIAIVRIALKMDDLLNSEERGVVSELLLDMLDIDDKYVLTSAISGIRAMGSTGLCPKEFLANKVFLSKIAAIVMKHNKQTDLCRYGCAVLAVFSYDVEAHDLLAETLILNVLFANIRSEDAITRELVANTLCNLSLHPLACETMINMNVVELLGELSSSTSETILDLCSKSLCNLTCNKALHQSMIQNNVLEILLMISLVRTVSSHTKCTCAKALLNLMTDDNIMMITSSGAIRIFASLSSNPFSPVQKVCSKGFHLMTINVNRRRELVKNRAVLHSLFNMMKGTSTTSSRVKNRLGISIINLLSCPETNFDAIKAGALSCLKVVATLGHEQLRDATGRLIITLASDIKFHSLLAKEPIVPMLILILQEHETPEVFEVAIQGLCCLAGFETFKKIMFRDKAIEAMIGTIFSGKVGEIRIAREICRSFTHLSFVYEQIESIIATNAFAIALSVMDEAGLTAVNDCRMLLFILARNLSEPTIARKYLVDQGIFQLLVKILLRDSYEVSQSPPPVKGENFETPGIKSLGYAVMLKIILNLSNVPQLHVQVMQQGLMSLIRYICLPIHSSTVINNSSTVPPVMEVIAEDCENVINGSGPGTPSHLAVQVTAPFSSQRSRILTNTQPRTPSSRSFIVSPTGSLSGPHPVLRKHQSLEAIATKGDSANIDISNDDNSGDDNSVGAYNDEGTGTPKKAAAVSSNNQTNNQKFRATIAQSSNTPNNKAGVSHHAPAQSNNDKPGETQFRLYFSFEQVEDITKSLQLLSQTASCHNDMVDRGIMEICKALIYAELTPVGRSEMSACLAQIAQSKSCRESLVQQGAVELLIALWVNGDSNTQAQCATALAYLSEITIVQKGIVASLLLLDLAIEGKHYSSNNHHSPSQLMGTVMSHAGRLGPANVVAIKEISHQIRSNLVNPSHLPSVSSASSVMSGSTVGSSLKGGSIDSSAPPEGPLPAVPLSTAHDGSAVKTLSSTLLELLRDLMPDKRKYDDYRTALQTYHEANMASNEFQPPKNIHSTHKNLIETRRHNNTHARSSPAVSEMRQSQDFTKSAPFTRMAISIVHETYLTSQEHAALKVSFEEFTFTPPVNNPGYKPEFGGLSKELTVQLKLPTIPTDRDLEPVNRHDELAKMPINEVPLPKDTRIPPNSHKSHAELIKEEEDRKTAEEEAARVAAAEAAANEAAAAAALATNNGKPNLNVVTGVTNNNGRKGSVLNKMPSGGIAAGGTASGRPSLAQVGKFASASDNLAKSKGLDARSPLIKASSQLFTSTRASVASNRGGGEMGQQSTSSKKRLTVGVDEDNVGDDNAAILRKKSPLRNQGIRASM